MSLLRSWYWDEIRSLAQEALKEHPDDDEKREDWLHETIDGHEYVIYTAKAQAVLCISESHDAMKDETGETGTDEQRAYFAMMADVRDQISAEQS